MQKGLEKGSSVEAGSGEVGAACEGRSIAEVAGWGGRVRATGS